MGIATAWVLLSFGSTAHATEPKDDGSDVDAEADRDDADADATEDGLPANLDPHEDDHETYWFLGLRWRDIIIPGFQVRLFADDGPDAVNVFSVGLEATYRNHGLEIIPSLWYADYSMDPVLFRGNGDDDNELERVSSDLKIIFASVDVMFELAKSDDSRFAFSAGFGVGVGFVFDELYRNQVYPNDPNNYDSSDHTTFTNCRAANDPAIPFGADGSWCDAENDHYGNYTESSWANGGSKPNLFPWLALPQLSFRYKPIKQLQVRVDGGWSLSGFFFGMSHSYGF